MNENVKIEWKNDKRHSPKKVYVSNNGIGFCPICHGTLWQNKDESNYCFRCGQKVEW